jgi:hypothetical protein
MLSHAAFLLSWKLYCDKYVTLDKKVTVNYHEVVDNGLARFENEGSSDVLSGTDKLFHTLRAHQQKLMSPQKLLLKNNESKAFQSKTLHSVTVDDSYQSKTVGHAIAECVKHSSAPYLAVVNGKQARRNPITEYARKLSRIDAADFWQAYGELSDDEQNKISRDVASAARASRRDRA